MGGNLATSRRARCGASQASAWVLLLALGICSGVLADPPTGVPAGAADGTSYTNAQTLPQENFFSSIKESLRLGFDHEEVRGHFDLGTPPNSHRYYCLVDTKTRTREPDGVLGQPVPMPDGTTGLKIDSVSLYGCDKAEKQGMLVTAGYLLKAPVAGAVAASLPSTPPSAPSSPPIPTPTSTPASAPPAVSAPAPAVSAPTVSAPAPLPAAPFAPAAPTPAKIDVAGIALGMSLDEVRALLKAKKLREYTELSEALSYLDSASGAMQSIAAGRFVSVVAAWTPSPAAATFQGDGESYQVMFTPVPGKERAMAIVHSVGYSPANAVREVALESGLVAKYGGFADASNLPDSPTWRFQSGGNVQVGDSCNRRGLFGGLGALNAGTTRENLALKTVPEEFRFETERCGIAIVTEDHFIANGGALPEDRLVTRFTVSAYSPPLASEGAASAAQLIRAAGGALHKAGDSRPKDQAAPNL